jgi:hypothetical protein
MIKYQQQEEDDVLSLTDIAELFNLIWDLLSTY